MPGRLIDRQRPAFVLALIVSMILALGACRARRTEKKSASAVPTKPPPVRLLYPPAPGSFVRLVSRIRPALVNLYASSPVAGGPQTLLPAPKGTDAPFLAESPLRERVTRSLGSGVIFNRQGHVLTALRVIRNAPDLRARLHDGTTAPLKIVGQDPDTGIAVLQILRPARGTLRPLVPAPLGDSALLKPGEWVLAVGDPFGTTPYVSAGLVSSAGASKGLTLARPGYLSFIATDARINLANAGGPLLNASGQVVGINMVFDDEARPLGFSVPINLVRDVLPTLLKHGQVARSWVGIYVKPVTVAAAQKTGLGGARGALVSEVVPGGPAAQAGIRAGDIILEFDGKAVGRHMELTFAAARTPSGKTVIVKLWRDRREHALSLRLERKPQ
jgi:S1-C subfamily serine protease